MMKNIHLSTLISIRSMNNDQAGRKEGRKKRKENIAIIGRDLCYSMIQWNNQYWINRREISIICIMFATERLSLLYKFMLCMKLIHLDEDHSQRNIKSSYNTIIITVNFSQQIFCSCYNDIGL